jgi:hypothetical protein
VVIDAATRQQIGGLFECQDLGTVELKGRPAVVPTWQVLSENRTLGQFEALRSGATPLVGRDEEMELLLRRWAQATTGTSRRRRSPNCKRCSLPLRDRWRMSR